MSNHTLGKPKSFPGPLGTVLCAWFLGGMLLSLLLSGIYSVVGLLLPPLFFFLSSWIYLTGGLLGGMWSRERLRLRGLSRSKRHATLFALLLTIGFLLLGFLFSFLLFRR